MPLSPSPTGAGRCLGGRGGLCWDACGVGRVPLSLPSCRPRCGRLRATSHLRALGTQGGKADAGGICPGMGYHSSWIRATQDPPASYPDSSQELPRVSPHAGICDVRVHTPSPITAPATMAAQSLLGWQNGCAASPCELLASSTLFTAHSGLVKKYVQLLCLFSQFHRFVSPVLLKFCTEDK